MSALQPLMTLLGQVERERDDLAAACQRAAAVHRSALEQAEQLRSYRTEYQTRWSEQFRTDGRIELVHCYRGFMERLTMAVDHQHQSALDASDRLEATQLALRDGEIRVASVRKLIERRLAEARIASDRREQKASDEFASRAAWSPNELGGVFGGV
jgi:flagellar FliJ protein